MEKPRLPKLCHRCEFRARFLESTEQPRMECGGTHSVYSCYMYRPVKPLLLRKNKGDNRPISPPMLSARMHNVGLPEDIECIYRKTKQGYMFYWIPKENR